MCSAIAPLLPCCTIIVERNNCPAPGSSCKRDMADLQNAKLNPFRSAPNLLSFFRICLAPILVAAILEHRFRLGFVLFLVAGVTDALDGLLARALKQRTVVGQYLDPIADKLLLSTLFLVLLYEGFMPLRVTVLVFGRDVCIVLVAAILFAAAGRREFAPSLVGKANTLAQVTAIAVVLLHQLTQAPWVVALRSFALWTTMVLTVVSGLDYAWHAARRPSTPPSAAHDTK